MPESSLEKAIRLSTELHETLLLLSSPTLPEPEAPQVRLDGVVDLYLLVPQEMYGATPGADTALRQSVDDVRDWFRMKVGKTFRNSGVVTKIYSTRTTEQLKLNPWDGALGELALNHIDPWAEGHVAFIIIDSFPDDGGPPGSQGGAGIADSSGVVVKDGESINNALNKLRYSPEWNTLCGMIAHELGHAFSANYHEDTPGSNIEWEWWNWPNCEIAPVNVEKLKNSRFMYS